MHNVRTKYRDVQSSALANDGDIVLGSFEFPERNIDGDTTLALSL